MALLAMLPACGNNGPKDAPVTKYGTFVDVTFSSSSVVPLTALTWSSNLDIDTDASTMCDTHNDQASRFCVVAGSSITLASGATLRAHGSKPLVLLATSTSKLKGAIDLEGTIDVSSKHDGSPPGAGAAALADCPNTTAATGNSGGFGGSFGGTGGNGGPVDGTMGTAAPALTAFPMNLRGGCPGGTGSSTTAGTAPAGGNSGGAVLIIAESLQINGTINASGAGGHGGPAVKSGGGGGGSGGMIVVDVKPESVTPGTGPIQLFANGGGGGQGGTQTGLGAGAGDDGGESPDPMTAGAGGKNIALSGGSGGIGSSGAKNDGTKAGNASNSGGGGGGGGAAGFIFTPPIAGALIAPLVTSPFP